MEKPNTVEAHNTALLELLAVYRREFAKMYFPSEVLSDAINKAEEEYEMSNKQDSAKLAEIASGLGLTSVAAYLTKTKKLSRAEVNAELALRMGEQSQHDNPLYHLPDFFTDRNAAAELAAWIFANTRYVPDITTHNLQADFITALDALVINADPAPRGYLGGPWVGLLATPEQITLAACKALNLSVEVERC